MQVEISRGVVTVTGIENLDANGSESLFAILGGLSMREVDAILLDLRRVGTVDTAAVSTLVRLYSCMTVAGAELEVLAGSSLRRSLAGLGMDKLFAVHPVIELADSWQLQRAAA